VRAGAVAEAVGAVHRGDPVRLVGAGVQYPPGLAACVPARWTLVVRLRRGGRGRAVDASAGGLVRGGGDTDAAGASARPTLATRWRVGLDRPDHRRGADLDLQPADRRGDAALRARRHTRPDRRPDGGTER